MQDKAMKRLKVKRFVAYWIDMYACGIVLSIPIKLLQGQPYFSLGYFVLLGFIWLLCKDSYRGQSIGKYLLKLQVMDQRTGGLASPIQCIKRNIYHCLSLIEWLVLYFNSEGKRLGDYACHTMVVERPKR